MPEQDKKTDPSVMSPVPVVEKKITPPSPLDPTRYGDWEKNGRCIDF